MGQKSAGSWLVRHSENMRDRNRLPRLDLNGPGVRREVVIAYGDDVPALRQGQLSQRRRHAHGLAAHEHAPPRADGQLDRARGQWFDHRWSHRHDNRGRSRSHHGRRHSSRHRRCRLRDRRRNGCDDFRGRCHRRGDLGHGRHAHGDRLHHRRGHSDRGGLHGCAHRRLRCLGLGCTPLLSGQPAAGAQQGQAEHTRHGQHAVDPLGLLAPGCAKGCAGRRLSGRALASPRIRRSLGGVA